MIAGCDTRIRTRFHALCHIHAANQPNIGVNFDVAEHLRKIASHARLMQLMPKRSKSSGIGISVITAQRLSTL